ncbi:hypothetical protein CWI66_17605 [Halomonas sp. 141]|nr:hypothetical protein CWI66_17605 [Halomonas sp. 141]
MTAPRPDGRGFPRLSKIPRKPSPNRAGIQAGSALALLGVDLRPLLSIMYKNTVLSGTVPC